MANEIQKPGQRTLAPTAPVQHGRGTVAPTNTALAGIARDTGETMATAMAAKQAAMVQARYAIAMARPRDLDTVRERLLKEASRPGFADAAIYRKPVGDGIEGPSIRFVEAALVAMGNVWSDVEVVSEDEDKRILRIEVFDAENNLSHAATVAVHKTVERRTVRDGDEVLRQRTNSKGQSIFIKRATDDEILNTANALTSKALRTVGLRLIPGWLTDEVIGACYATLEAKVKDDPDAAKRKLLDAFARVGVSAEQVKRYLGRDEIGKLQPAEHKALLGLFNAIKDGEATWAEVMDKLDADRAPAPAAAPPAGKGGGALKARLAAQAAPTAPAAPAPKLDDVPGWNEADGPEPTQPEGFREPGEEG